MCYVIAHDVLAAIERMEDGATATIDYSKNDVFAAELICYKMAILWLTTMKSRGM